MYVLFPYKDSRLKPYFEDNLAEIQSFCKPSQYHLPYFHAAYFGNTEGDVVAYCEQKRNGYIMVFNKRFWDALNETNKRQLMMHEMVHCLFKQPHFNSNFHFMATYFVAIPEPMLGIQFREYLYRKCWLNY